MLIGRVTSTLQKHCKEAATAKDFSLTLCFGEKKKKQKPKLKLTGISAEKENSKTEKKKKKTTTNRSGEQF